MAIYTFNATIFWIGNGDIKGTTVGTVDADTEEEAIKKTTESFNTTVKDWLKETENLKDLKLDKIEVKHQ